MATTTNNGITLRYPNDPCPVFNPCIFNLTGTLARTRVFVNSGNKSYTAVYQTPNGGTLDLRQFMQVFFDGITLGDDLKQLGNVKRSELGKNVNVTLFALASDGATIAQFNVTVFCVWAGMAVGEDYERISDNETRELVWFRNFPLTVGLYSEAAKVLTYDSYTATPQDGGLVRNLQLTSKGIFNINIDADGGSDKNYITITDYSSPYVDHYLIRIDREATEGVYLRWIDRHGFWRYWLFKQGDPTRQAASRFGMWNRNNLADYDRYMGWQDDAGRRQSFTRNDIQPLCAPLVDQDTFDMLQDVATSPCVDMFIGYDSHDEPMWAAVTVEAGSYTKDVKKPEQDFLLNLVLPEIPVQTL